MDRFLKNKTFKSILNLTSINVKCMLTTRLKQNYIVVVVKVENTF